MTTIGKKIKDLREKKGLSPEELAENLHFTKSIIWSYEINKKEPSIIHIEKLADYFGVSAEYLLNKECEKILIHLKVPILDLLSDYSFMIDNEEVSEQELEEAISYIRAKRILIKEKNGYFVEE